MNQAWPMFVVGPMEPAMPLLNASESDAIQSLSVSPRISPGDGSQVLNLKTVLHRHIHLVLDLNRGNKLKTARQLGISRSTLYRILNSEFLSQF